MMHGPPTAWLTVTVFAALAPTAVIASSAAQIEASTPADAPTAVAARLELAAEVRRRLIRRGIPIGTQLDSVVAAVAAVPRHRLVPAALAPRAYEGSILPIGHGQTSTDPEYVAYMTALLRLRPTDRVLEVGTGSGYQAAVLGKIVAEVRTVEIVAPLAASATANLAALGYVNVHVRSGDGYEGWRQFAPYDAIMVTAGATCLPPALIAQLKVGGRMAIPLGQSIASEQLLLIKKHRGGGIRAVAHGSTMFVDFTGRIARSTPLMRFRPGGIDVHKLRICDA